jgi:hypothetical protein
MRTFVHLLPGLACGAILCVPMALGMRRRWLRGRRQPSPGEVLSATNL